MVTLKICLIVSAWLLLSSYDILLRVKLFLAFTYLLKVNNENTRLMR